MLGFIQNRRELGTDFWLGLAVPSLLLSEGARKEGRRTVSPVLQNMQRLQATTRAPLPHVVSQHVHGHTHTHMDTQRERETAAYSEREKPRARETERLFIHTHLFRERCRSTFI